MKQKDKGKVPQKRASKAPYLEWHPNPLICVIFKFSKKRNNHNIEQNSVTKYDSYATQRFKQRNASNDGAQRSVETTK
jgi:hypothetical protein